MNRRKIKQLIQYHELSKEMIDLDYKPLGDTSNYCNMLLPILLIITLKYNSNLDIRIYRDLRIIFQL